MISRLGAQRGRVHAHTHTQRIRQDIRKSGLGKLTKDPKITAVNVTNILTEPATAAERQ